MRIALVILTLAPLFALHACSGGNDDEPVAGPGGVDAGTQKDSGSSSNDDSSTAKEDGSGTPDAKTDAPKEAATGAGKKIFVTSFVYTGSLGGTTGADGKCASRAFDANVPGTFKAWISTSGADDAKTRLAHGTGAYVRMDNVIVANDWAQLASNNHLAAIDIDEKGAKVAASSPVWTNTLPDGTSKGDDHCVQWASASNGQKGAYGVVDAKDSNWTNAAVGACQPQARLYCVEQ
jgi:hypothetical protein